MHVEDVKDPDKVLLPSDNLVLISLREDESGDCVPFALLDDLPLDLRHSSVIKPPVRDYSACGLLVRLTLLGLQLHQGQTG